MKNKLGDLHNILFEQLERLNDEDKKGEVLQEEMQRARAITGVASQIIANGQLVMRAIKVKEDVGQDVELPAMLEAGDDKPAGKT